MDGTNLEELRELVEFLRANGIAEFEMERTDLKVRLRFEGKGPTPEPVQIDMARLNQMMATTGVAPASVAGVAPGPTESAGSTAGPLSSEDASLHEVKSPIVGTFYESSSPGAPAFVKLGDEVEVCQVLCIIEAMKLVNEIEADVAGEVVKRIAATGQPVEYGQPLFAIKPR